MAEQFSDLEKAINTLVSNFHGASADKGATLKTDEFKNLLSSQLPNLVKTGGSDVGFGEVLKQMGVKDGEGITFKHFWSLVQNLATSQFGLLSHEKVSKCTCLLICPDIVLRLAAGPVITERLVQQESPFTGCRRREIPAAPPGSPTPGVKAPGGKGLWEPQSDYIYFCSKHFTLDSFELSGVSGYRRLKDDAVPVMVEIPSAQKGKSSRGRSKTQSGDKHLSSPSSPDKDLSDCKESLINIALGHIVEDEEAESIKSATEDHKNESSPPSPLLLQTPAPDHPTDQPTEIPSAPPSPSRYMRRLPPPPGFYLAKEHSYAQLCPLEWRKRYEKATDNLEKALRLLRAARRRENRLRLTLLRLQDTRLKQTLSQIPDRRKDGQDSHNRSEPRQSAKPARSGQNSGLEEVEEAETEGTGEEMELLTDESWRKEPSAKLKDGVEDEDGCCFYCGRGREDEDAKETGSPRSRTVQARRGRGRTVFRETMAESKSHLKAPVCQNMDPEQLNEMLLQIHPQSTATFQELTTSSPHLQHLQLLQPDLSLLHADMSSTDVSFTQGKDGGGGMCHVFLVPVSSESKEMSRMGVDSSIQKTQSILMAEETFQEVISEQGVDMGLRQSGLSANQNVQQTNVTSRMLSGDVTQRLKEHLEGFQLQLSSEFID